MKNSMMLFLLFLVFLQPLHSQELNPDPTFGINGLVTASTLPNYAENLTDMQIDPSDGKIITCGYRIDYATADANYKYIIRKYKTNGDPDTTFGVDGCVVTLVAYKLLYSGNVEVTSNLKVLSNGKILIVGGIPVTNVDYGVVRYNADGSLDTSFGNNGITTMDFGSSNGGDDVATSIAIQSDNKIVVTGKKSETGLVGIMRLNENGSMDSTFGVNGVVKQSMGPTGNSGNCIMQQSNGKIIIAGSGENPPGSSNSLMLMIRLNQDGTRDTTFGVNGFVGFATSGTYQKSSSLIVDSNDQIYFGGIGVSPPAGITFSGSKLIIANFDSNGSLLSDFGTAGIISNFTIPTNENTLYKMIKQPDGKILITGRSRIVNSNGIYCFFIARLNSNGTLDTTFAVNGVLKITFPNNTGCQSRAMVIQSDNKIILAGSINYPDALVRGSVNFGLVRLVEGPLATTSFNANSFSLSPNPFHDKVTLNINLENTQNLSADLFDNNGRKIQNLIQDKMFFIGDNTTEVQMPESLTKGVYFIKVFNGSTNTTLKIIK
jgi:uncharacterized delta-60 repeat protein